MSAVMEIGEVDTEALFDLREYDGARLEVLEAQTSPKHVAKRIAQHEPAKLAIIIRRLQEGVPIKRVAEDQRVGRNTVYAIIEQHMGGMKAYRERLSGEFYKAAHMGVERVQELMGSCDNVTQAAIATGIMVEKAVLLSGQQVEAVDASPLDPKTREAWNDKWRQLQERRAKGRVVETSEEVAA